MILNVTTDDVKNQNNFVKHIRTFLAQQNTSWCNEISIILAIHEALP